MKVKMEPQHGKGPGINIHGKHVTPLVWELFSYSINANRIDCPWYQARTQAGAFFQGGSDRPAGEWVFIEFWKPDTAHTYVNYINMALTYLDDDGIPKSVSMVCRGVDQERRLEGLLRFYEYTYEKVDQVYTFTPIDALAITTLVELQLKGAIDFYSHEVKLVSTLALKMTTAQLDPVLKAYTNAVSVHDHMGLRASVVDPMITMDVVDLMDDNRLAYVFNLRKAGHLVKLKAVVRFDDYHGLQIEGVPDNASYEWLTEVMASLTKELYNLLSVQTERESYVDPGNIMQSVGY